MSIENKYVRPSRLDIDSYGKIRKVITDDSSVEFYIQCSQDTENPLWLKLGDFFEKAFANYLVDEKFMDAALRMYRYNSENPMTSIQKTIEEK